MAYNNTEHDTEHDTAQATPADPSAALVGNLRRQNWLWALVGISALILLWLLKPILLPFILGAVLAYICDPMVERLARTGISRAIATALVVLGLILAITLLVLILIPLLQQEATTLATRAPMALDWLRDTAVPWINQQFGLNLQLDMASLKDLVQQQGAQAQSLAQRLLGWLLGTLSVGGAALIGILTTVLLTPIVMFYLLRDCPTTIRRVQNIIPLEWQPRALRILRDIDAVLGEFLHGQMLVMLALALYYTVALWLCGLRFALPVGLLTGLLIFIPYVGYSTGLLLAVLAACLQFEGWNLILAVLAVYGAGQLLESFVLTPFLVGERIGLHPLAVIFALMAFAQLFGFVGVLIALPASAALLVALRELRHSYFNSPFYRGSQTAPPAQE